MEKHYISNLILPNENENVNTMHIFSTSMHRRRKYLFNAGIPDGLIVAWRPNACFSRKLKINVRFIDLRIEQYGKNMFSFSLNFTISLSQEFINLAEKFMREFHENNHRKRKSTNITGNIHSSFDELLKYFDERKKTNSRK